MKALEDSPRGIIFLSNARVIWGAEMSLITLIEALPPGIPVALVSPNAELAERVRTRDIVFVSPGGDSLKDWLRTIQQARRLIDVEVVSYVVFSLALGPKVMALKLLVRGRDNVVLDLHDRLPSRAGRAKLHLFGGVFDAVLPVSDYVASQVPRSRRLPAITRPINSRAIATPRHARRNGKVVGVVGRLDPDKRIEFALEVARARPELHFCIFGAPSDHTQAYADALMEGSTHLPNVQWMGRRESSTVYSAIDVLLITNPQEALGRTIIEAQMSAVSVVGPASGGSLELLIDSPIGFLYEPMSVSDASRKIDEALQVTPDLLRASATEWTQRSDPRSYALAYFAALDRRSR